MLMSIVALACTTNRDMHQHAIFIYYRPYLLGDIGSGLCAYLARWMGLFHTTNVSLIDDRPCTEDELAVLGNVDVHVIPHKQYGKEWVPDPVAFDKLVELCRCPDVKIPTPFQQALTARRPTALDQALKRSINPALHKAMRAVRKHHLRFGSCRAMAMYSKDPVRRVGCILVDPETGSVVASGYNGLPRGMNDKLPERYEKPLKEQLICHAELNTLLMAGRFGIKTAGMIMYCTKFPCIHCARAICQAGIPELVIPIAAYTDIKAHYDEQRDFPLIMEMFNECGVRVTVC